MAKLVDITGVGPVMARACVAHGFTSVEAIANAKFGEFVAVPGVSEVRAKQLIAAAKELLARAASSPVADAPSASDKAEKVVKSEKKAKKDKNKLKKDKKKKKNKKTKKKKSNKS